ncbi:MAG: DUF4105 domain-containing protein [Oligoflexia bacterium]|nr:DUF4105 domain-containing protein [Oligoflexia bacterium]
MKFGRSSFASLVLLLGLGPSALAQRGDVELRLAQPGEPALERFVSEVSAALPASLRRQLGGEVRIRFKKLGTRTDLAAPLCPGDSGPKVEAPMVYGQSNRLTAGWRSRQITLHSGFVSEIKKGPEGARRYACGHGDFYRLAMATVIHELAHLYDNSNSPIGGGGETEFDPVDSANPPKPLRSVSDRPAFLALTGFGVGLSSNLPRSPDPYEYQNAAENFAVNLEYFLLDPEYACRRPTFHDFYRRHFGVTPARASCEISPKAFLASYRPGETTVVNLDPERIYEVHYLLAAEGRDVSSRWGHAMFRLVVCAPGRVLGPDCLKDVGHHVAVSYRANITGLSFSSVGGLLGKYPSQMFLLPFLDTVSEYTKGELRDVLSYPLKLDRTQLRSFVLRALEQHWQYSDRYYFVTKNCATESLGFLQGALNDHPVAGEPVGIRVPTELAELFERYGLLDRGAVDGPAAKGRYRFPSMLRSAEASFESLRSAGITGELSLEEYFTRTSASERLALFEGVSEPARLAPHFVALELLARERVKQLMLKAALEWLGQQNESSPEYAEVQTTVERLRGVQKALMPWNLAPLGYGVARADEVASDQRIQALLAEMVTLFNSSAQVLNRPLEALNAEMAGIRKNILKFLSVIPEKTQPPTTPQT